MKDTVENEILVNKRQLVGDEFVGVSLLLFHHRGPPQEIKAENRNQESCSIVSPFFFSFFLLALHSDLIRSTPKVNEIHQFLCSIS